MKESYMEIALKIKEKCEKAYSCTTCEYYVKYRGCRFKDGFPMLWNLDEEESEK